MIRKKLIVLIITVIMGLVPCIADNPTDDSLDIPMTETPTPSDNTDIKDPSKGKRLPQRPVMCTISRRDGVLLQSTESGEIISYLLVELD